MTGWLAGPLEIATHDSLEKLFQQQRLIAHSYDANIVHESFVEVKKLDIHRIGDCRKGGYLTASGHGGPDFLSKQELHAEHN